MLTKDRERMAKLAASCEVTLKEPARQMGVITRGDMRAIVSAWKDISKARRIAAAMRESLTSVEQRRSEAVAESEE